MIKLSKGGSIKLKKDTDSLTHIFVGMGWEIAKGSRTVTREVPVKSLGNLFRKMFGCELVTKTVTETVTRRTNGEYDLDASCVLLNKDGSPIGRRIEENMVCYHNKEVSGIKHGGDNLTGSDGEHDDEVIDIDLNGVRKETATIVVFMNIYQAENKKQSFRDLTKAYLRIVNAANNEELCRYDLTQFNEKDTALVLGKLTREGNEWTFTAIGNSLKANYPIEVVNQLNSKILNNN